MNGQLYPFYQQTMKRFDFKKLFKKNKDFDPEKTHTMTHTKFLIFGDTHGTIFKKRDRRPNFYIGVFLKTINILIVAILMVGIIAFGTVWGIAKAYLETTPTLNTEEIENQSETTYLYDKNGDFLAAYVGNENREWANSDEIPDMLKSAFVSVEDVRFYYHSGIDVKRLVGAAISNFMNESVQGGSTITQQLIKNTLLSFDQTYKRKIQEAFLAIQLENEYTKDEILVSYLNTIDMGAGNYGVKAAAKDYLNKDLDELTIKECALLAGITQNPYSYNPRRAYYGTGSIERVETRLNLVLNRMYEAGYITKDEYDNALFEPLEIVEKSTVHSMYAMPYFVEYAIDDVITKLLESRNMKTDDTANRGAVELEIRNNGYRIYTTVDPAVQLAVEESLSTWDKYPSTAKSSDSVITTKNSDGSITEVMQPQAAAVVYDYKTGQLRALVGGRENPDIKKGINRVNATMPVGSSIKPLAVYAPALDTGLSPASIVDNIPVPIDGWNTPTGYPATSEGTFGPRTLRYGMTNSINILTAHVLLDHVGIERSKEYLIKMGVNPKHINANPAGLALGTSGITPVEMAVAYGCLANEGKYISPISFTLILDKDGNVIYDATQTQETRQAISRSTSYLITDMLQDVVEKGTGKNARISGMNVGGKTGTNQENRGVYFSGITPYYSAAVWIGHDDYKPLKSNAYASSYAAPLWKDFMSEIHEGLENKSIIDASPAELSLVQATVCPVSGLLATENCSKDLSGRALVTDWFTRENVPTNTCDVHRPLSSICAVSNKFATPYCPDEQIIEASPVFLDADSPYFSLSDDLRSKLFPLLFPKTNASISSMTPDSPLYSTYYCTIHNATWEETAIKRPQAVKLANQKITEVTSYIQNGADGIDPGDVNELYAMIESLETMMNNVDRSSEEIIQRTNDLDILYQSVVTKYTEPSEDPESPEGPEGSEESNESNTSEGE